MAVDYSKSEKDRELIIKRRQRNTARVFERMRKDVDDRISEMNMLTVSDRVKRQQLEEIRDELQKSLRAFYSDLEAGLKNDMESIGESVLSDSKAFYKTLDMPIQAKITSFPVEIMESVVNGSVYKDKWFLSEAIWGDYKQKLQSINDVVTSGIGLNLSSLEIAKNLEQFVDHKAMKPGSAIITKCLQDPNTGKLYSMDYVKRHPEKDWTGFAPKTSRFFYGKVDYNAQRLSRTLVSHAYQQNVVKQAQANPFATGVMWLASGGERMCEICEERDGKIFPVDDVPMDHPNGMCTFSVETPSMMEMSNTLADWVNGEPTPYDDQLNAYYEGRPIEHKIQLSDDKGNSGVVSKDPNDYSYLTIEQLKELNATMPLSEEDYNAIYGGNGCRGYIGTSNSYKINKALRNDDMSLLNEKSHDVDLKTIGAMKRVTGENAIQSNIRAMRMVGQNGGYLKSVFGLSEEQIADMAINPTAYVDALQGFVGTKIQEKGFMSVSVNTEDNLFGNRNVMLDLLCPTGTHAYVTENIDEAEMILSSGTEYEIISIKEGKNEWGRPMTIITALIRN